MKDRDTSLDFARGFAMFLVVLGHTSSIYQNFIYLFHVPLFFIISGTLFKRPESIRIAIYNKWKRLYFPNLKYGLFFLLFHNIFVKWGFYESNSWYSFRDYVKSFIKIICFGNEELGGAMWFLRSLFCVYCLYLLYCFLGRKGKIILSVLIVMIGWYMAYNNILYPLRSVVTIPCIVFPYILIGGGKIVLQVNKMLGAFRYLPIISFIFTGIILTVLSCYISVDLAHLELPNLFLYYIIAIIGLLFVLSGNQLIEKTYIQKMFIYVGKNSIPILALHFLVFKLFTLLYLVITGKELALLSKSLVPSLSDKVFLPIIYAIIGIAMPLFFRRLFKLLKNRILKSNI